MMTTGAANRRGNQSGCRLEVLGYFDYFTASTEEYRTNGATESRFLVPEIHLQCAAAPVEYDRAQKPWSVAIFGRREFVP